MQAVTKKIIYFSLMCLLGLPNRLSAQSIAGYYVLDPYYDYYTISIKAGNTFIEIFGYNMDHVSYLISGYYLQQGDTFVLFGEKHVDPTPSYFRVVEQDSLTNPEFGKPTKIRDDAADISFKVMDYDNHPIKNATISFDKYDISSVFEKYTDSQGQAFAYTAGKAIDVFYCFYLGYDVLKVDMKDFWGKRTSLKIYLGVSSEAEERIIYSDKNTIRKYLIKKKKGKIVGFTALNPLPEEASPWDLKRPPEFIRQPEKKE